MLLNWTRVWEYPAIADAIITPIVMLHRCICGTLTRIGQRLNLRLRGDWASDTASEKSSL